MTEDLLDLQLQLRHNRQAYALATVVEILGSSSAKPSAKAVIAQSGTILAGWVGGGCAQAMVAAAARTCLSTGESCVIDIDLNDEIFGAGMPCGGSMRVFVEPVIPKPVLWLMGHGRIVETLCDFAQRLNFAVIVNDPKAQQAHFPNAQCVLHDDHDYQQLQPQAGDFVVIATHHKGDYASISRALQSEAVYIALVSSQKRAQLILRRLAQEGFTTEALARIRAPAGLDLGAKLPEEIALAIISEMVLLRRGGSGLPLSQGTRISA